MAMARRTTTKRVASMLQVLADSDARLKGLLPGFSAIEILERMILEMASK
jgi:hypothetical protein